MKTKICFKCNVEKEITEFYKQPAMKDGHVNKCKTCTKEDIKNNYENKSKDINFVLKERKRGRDKYHRLYENTGKSNKVASQKWIDKFPEKRKAHHISQYTKSPIKGLEKHHWSYNEIHYTDIIWLTKQEHSKSHRFIIYDQEQKMYRRIDTMELLNTKEKHNTWIQYCIINKED